MFLLPLILLAASCSAVDIEATFNVSETIAYFGYPVETHHVETDDGYIIEMQRIPYGRDTRKISNCDDKRPVIYFQHGLFGTAHEFVANLPTEAPAFIMADAGFDVWLGNIRGTNYGLKHKTLNTTEQRFWNYTLYDHASIDMPNQIDYVLKQTNQPSLYYIGHSEGTLVMFIHLSETDVKWQNKIRGFYAWGPTAGFLNKFIDWPLNLLASDLVSEILRPIYGVSPSFPFGTPNAIKRIGVELCSLPVIDNACSIISGYFVGYETRGNWNVTRTGVYISGTSSTSWKNILHFSQLLNSHQLQKFDYGRKKNEEIYGSPTPPLLDISKIVAPTYLYFSGDDRLTTEANAKSVILKHIGPGLRGFVDLDHFSHLDYAVGLRANQEVYQPMIRQMYEDLKKNGC